MLVTESTSEAFNILLPLLGAIVTDAGGLLSHAAIMSREYGIPSVVGTREGTGLIPDGARVRVDGDAGEVDGALMEGVVPLERGTRRVSVRLEGGRAGGGGAVGPAAPARRRALGRRSSRPSPAGERQAIEDVAELVRPLGSPLAVRSSAVDEDGAEASFAGQHMTLLNVPGVDAVADALREIWWSANSDSAITYRQRVGLFRQPSVGVVVQSLLDPECAGVMFTETRSTAPTSE